VLFVGSVLFSIVVDLAILCSEPMQTCACSAPGLHDLIAMKFDEIPATCKRFGVNYMGCHGGVKV
jgi:hypothetical protein